MSLRRLFTAIFQPLGILIVFCCQLWDGRDFSIPYLVEIAMGLRFRDRFAISGLLAISLLSFCTLKKDKMPLSNLMLFYLLAIGFLAISALLFFNGDGAIHQKVPIIKGVLPSMLAILLVLQILWASLVTIAFLILLLRD